MSRRAVERRPWPRDARYLVGDDGSVVGPSGRVLRTYLHSDGRLSMNLFTGGRQRTVKVHILVAEAWHGLRPEGLEVAHGNGDPIDNRPDNLRWSTRRENEADKRAHGTVVQGERVHFAKLTEAAVREIRAAYAVGNVSHSELATHYGVATATIGLALTGQTWAHVEGPSTRPRTTVLRGERHPRARLTTDDVREIRRARASGATVSALARRYVVARTAIYGVLKGHTWGHVA